MAQFLAKPKALFGFCQLSFAACSFRLWVWPNPAFSGHGFAVGQRWRFEGGVASSTMLLDKHAVPLTQSLGARGKGGIRRGRWGCERRDKASLPQGVRKAEGLASGGEAD